MNKTLLYIVFLTGITFSSFSQTLFTYGPHKGDAKDFLRAFNKNNAGVTTNRAKAMRDYLELYINSRLKIQEAREKGYDTLPHIKSEVDNLRAQIIENYMSDPMAITRLTQEAFQRSQKDIHVAHIFITSNGGADTVNAKNKLNDVLNRLAKGDDFMQVAQQFSDDPGARQNKGDLGHITVFTLPYALESIVYNTPVGKFSNPYTSRAGYHIFKNLGERKAVGKIKAQQILLAFPPGADEGFRSRAAFLADSLYKRIKAGDDFSQLATAFSNDYISANTGGNIPDIAVGQFDPVFEARVWALKSDGSVSEPILTSHGYHIVKRIALKPVVTDTGDADYMQELQQKVMADDRWKTSKDFIYERVRQKAGFKKSAYRDEVLWALSDSMLNQVPAGIGRSMNADTPLFTIGDTTIRVMQWIAYALAYRYTPDRTGFKPYPALMDEFSKAAMYEYYRANLEDFSDEFRVQMDEFRDGNLFFEIMQQEIWNRTQNDSIALKAIYQKNKSKYNWKESADAIIFFCADVASAKAVHDQMKKPGAAADWKKLIEPFSDKVVADLSRYEWTQIPGLEKAKPVDGMLTELVVNPTDNTASFAYIVKVHTGNSARTFAEARGLVMSDYQTELEEQWTRRLRKKYPVAIKQSVLAEISRE